MGKSLNKTKRAAFYKNRSFYIVLTAVFSVLLVADLLVLALVPNTTAERNMTGRSSFSVETGDTVNTDDTSEADGDTVEKTENADDASDAKFQDSDNAGAEGAGEEGADNIDRNSELSGNAGEDADGVLGSQGTEAYSEDVSASADLNADAGEEDVQSNASADDAYAKGAAKSGWFFLQSIRTYALLIAIILAVLDAGSIAMLVIRTRRKKREAEKELKEQAKEEGRVYIQKQPVVHKHNSKWTLVMGAAIVLIVAILVESISSASSGVEASQTTASNLSRTVELTSIDTTLPGTGTLTEEDAVDFELADGVEITKWYISNGDEVSEGDVLAKVDLVSVMSEIVNIQELIELLDEDLAAHEDEEADSVIAASAGGRIKAIYAEEDISVTDTMYESGALAVISLDGLMAVSLETDALAVGDSVVVILSSGEDVSGNVESAANGTVVVTISDDGPEIGESVTVYTEDEEEAGSGELYVHAALKVTGFIGTVEEIVVSAEETVDAGDILFELEDVELTAEYEILAEKREVLVEELNTLLSLYSTGYIYAETSGVITGISEIEDNEEDTDDKEETSSDSASTAAADSTSASFAASAEINTLLTSSSASVGCSDLILLSEDDAGEEAEDVDSNTAEGETAEDTTTQEETKDAESNAGGESEGESGSADTAENDDDEQTSAEEGTILGYITAVEETDAGYVLVIVTEDGEITLNITDETVYTYDGSGFVQADTSLISEGNLIYYTAGEGIVYIFELNEETDDNAAETQSVVGLISSIESENGSCTVTVVTLVSQLQLEIDTSQTIYTCSGTEFITVDVSDLSEGDIICYNAGGSGVIYVFSINADDDMESSTGDDATADTGDNSISDSADSGASDDANINTGTDNNAIASQNTENAADTQASQAADVYNSENTDAFGKSADTSANESATQDETLNSIAADSGVSAATSTEVQSGETSDADAAEEEQSVDYSVSKTTIYSITPQDVMTITITVDELDILSVEEGQAVQITLDAVPGQSFEGTVTAVNTSGSNSGGSSKYTAEVTLNREDNMLDGMNASVSIVLETQDVLTVTADALFEDGTSTFIYTSYDEKTETYGDAVEVTTGISDGTSVEIVSGLEEGDTYYYSSLDTVNYMSSRVSSNTYFSFQNAIGGKQ